MNDEADFIRQAQNGSVEAFSQLVRLNQGRVRGYISRYIRQPDTVDDLAQDVFFSAFKSLKTYDFRCALGTWLLGIARHRALTHLRDEASRKSHESGRLRPIMAEWHVEQAERQDVEHQERERLALMECITSLPANSSRLISEYYNQNRTSGEIAREMGKTESSVRMTLLRIRQSLRDCVEQKLQSRKAAHG